MTKVAGYFQYYNGTERLSKVIGLDIATAGGQYPMNFVTAYAAGARYIWLKCSQRTNFKDANFTAANIAAARSAGLKVGAYHFNQPSVTGTTTVNAQQEADWFMAKMQEEFGTGQFGDIMPMFDFEDSGLTWVNDDTAYDYIEAFINRVKTIVGRQCILYTANYLIQSFISPDTSGSQANTALKLVHSIKGGMYQVAPLMLAARAPDVYTGVNMPAEPAYPNSNYWLFGGYPTELWTTWQFSSDNPDVHMGATYGASSLDIDEDLIEGDIYTIMPPSQVMGLFATEGDTTVQLTWIHVPDTDKAFYQIYLNDAFQFSVSATDRTALVTGLTNGVSYKFQVAATDDWEIGELSSAVFATPRVLSKAAGYFQYYNGSQRNTKVLGLDISAPGGQYPMNYVTAYSQGVRYIWFRCSKGSSEKDADFSSVDIAAARAAGLKVGAYHFNLPSTTGYTTTDAETEADWFMAKMQEEFGTGQFGDIMPMFDFEDSFALFATNDIAYDYAEAFINRVKTVAGRQCILYTAVFYVDGNINPTGGTPTEIAQKLVHSTKGGIYQEVPLMLAARAPDVYTGVNRAFESPYPNYNYLVFGGYPPELWTTWQFSSDDPDVHMGATYGASSLDIDEDLIEGDIYTITPPSQVAGVLATAGDETVLLSWSAIPDTDKEFYQIYKDDVYWYSVPYTQTSTLGTGLTNGVSYKLQVAATDAWEAGELSEPAYVIPIAGVSKVLTGKKAKVRAYGSSIAFTDEATTTTDNRHYQITDTTKRVWCKDCVITVNDGGSPTTELYTLDRLSGRVIFTTTASRTITVTGAYLPTATIGCAFEYSYNLTADNVDANCFDTDFIQRQQALKSIEASITKFYDISHYFLDKWRTDDDYVLEFYSSSSASPDIRAWTKIDSDNPSATVDGLVQESVEFSGTSDSDGNCVSFGPF